MKHKSESFWRTPSGWVAILLIAFATYFLFMEHRAHLIEFLPFAILLLCPVMHLFMHRGHGHHHEGKDRDSSSKVENHKDSHHEH